MGTLQKFKLLATQCAVVTGIPTQSPTTSPVVRLRRRKTLRMLLSRPSDRLRRLRRPDVVLEEEDPPENNVSTKLKDLFVSSPPPSHEEKEKEQENDDIAFGSARRGGAAALRPVSATFRYRLLRRAWRPVLVTIPE